MGILYIAMGSILALSSAYLIIMKFITGAYLPQTVLIIVLITLIVGIALVVSGIKKLKRKKMLHRDTSQDEAQSKLSGSHHGGYEGMVCARCHKPVLTKEKFIAELSGMGMTLAPDGRNISFSGTFRSHDSMENYQSITTDKLKKLEGMKAIQCISCGKIYCVDCLAQFASMHQTSGGKACFSCGGALKEI